MNRLNYYYFIFLKIHWHLKFKLNCELANCSDVNKPSACASFKTILFSALNLSVGNVRWGNLR